tara:strand:+ start:27346 stop:28476 length:1131 start_codon:yes stop_codon:yes gene_type:complete
VFSSSYVVHAKDKKKKTPKVDHLALASLLIRDGHLKRAKHILKEAKTTEKGFQLDRYHTLHGILATKGKDYKKAAVHFELAIKHAKKTPPALFLSLSRSYYYASQYAKVIETIKRAPDDIKRQKPAVLMAIQSNWRLGKNPEAFAAIAFGQKHFPKMRLLKRLRILLLVELGLFQQASKESKAFLATEKPELKDYLAFAEGLRQARQYKRAYLLLEQARLIYPGKSELLLRLARAYLDGKKLLAAAVILERAAWLKPKLTVEAAELYRRARKFWSALQLNARVLDQTAKIRQRLGLWIELKSFEKVVLLVPRLSRLGLLRDERIVYALAYACFQTGRYAKAELWLKQLRSAKLFQKANVLRQAMQSCRIKRHWWCP